MADSANLWTVKDLAAFLEKPESWVYDNYRAVFAGCYVRLGQHVRFLPDQIHAWIADQNRPTENSR